MEAVLESPEPRPEDATSLLDLMLEALLPGTLLAASSFVLILGALSSVSQLHYNKKRKASASTSAPAPVLSLGRRENEGRLLIFHGVAYPEKLAQARVVGLARLALCVLQVLCEPEPHNLEHAVERLV